MLRRGAVRDRHRHADIGIVRVGGEGLGAVEHPAPSSVATAVVRVPAASEPASGSVSDQQPIHSPVASFGRYCCRCSSVPVLKMWFEQSEVCAATMIPTEPSTRDSSSMMIEYSM